MSPPDTIIWIHGDNLNPGGPALAAYPGAPAIWVWDDELLRAWRISLKRVVFIYECLLELPVVIRRGDVAEEINRFAAEHGANRVATAASPSPRFAEICDRLRATGLAVEVLDEPPFVATDRPVDLKRFSRYWAVARQSALRPRH
jgi:hypothetical protein